MKSSKLDAERCPAAELAVEAATIIRAYYSLWRKSPIDSELKASIPDLSESAEALGGAKVDHVMECLYLRLDAIIAYAPSVWATSRKGALFQCYVAANDRVQTISALACDADHTGRGMKLADYEKQQERLWASIIGALDDGQDEDLKIIRAWCFDPKLEKFAQGEGVVATVLKSAVA